MPIFAIFAATKVSGGNTEIAASAFSTYLIVRVIFELISGRLLSKSNDTQKLLATILGMAASAALGGFIATRYGFPFLFTLVAIVNLLGIIPYILYIHKNKNNPYIST